MAHIPFFPDGIRDRWTVGARPSRDVKASPVMPGKSAKLQLTSTMYELQEMTRSKYARGGQIGCRRDVGERRMPPPQWVMY